MITGGAFLFGTVVMAAWGHRPLRRLLRGDFDPRIVLACWLFAVSSVVLTGILAVVLLALPGHGGLQRLLHELGRCWWDLVHGALPGWERAAAGAGAVILCVVGARVVYVAAVQARGRRRRRQDLEFLFAVAASAGTGTVRWLDHPDPVAFSVSGRPGMVVLSDGLRRTLSPAALGATLEHEMAHLRGRHHLILGVVDAVAAALPCVPLFRYARVDIRELVELAADRAAVDRFGASCVAEALRALTDAVPPAPMASAAGDALAMADTAVVRRLHRLQNNTPPKLSSSRNFWCAVAAVVVPPLPSAVGLALLVALGCS